MTELERVIILISLANAAMFYAVTVIIFLVTRKTRLNKALAAQKLIWLILICFVAIPAYVDRIPRMPGSLRMLCWASLAIVTWWVLYEVYRANWQGSFGAFLRHVGCNAADSATRIVGKRRRQC